MKHTNTLWAEFRVLVLWRRDKLLENDLEINNEKTAVVM
jgi:hypothetical protein